MTASPVIDRPDRPEPPRPAPPRHPVDEVLPIPKLAVYGFQHVLAFYAGAVIVPILLANSIGLSQQELIHLINADLFTCGIASIIQSVGFWKIGVRAAAAAGGDVHRGVADDRHRAWPTAAAPRACSYIYGSVSSSPGCSPSSSRPISAKLIRFFPPVVTGTVITIIGIALLPVAALPTPSAAARPTLDPSSGKNLAYAMGTLAIIVDHPAGVQAASWRPSRFWPAW